VGYFRVIRYLHYVCWYLELIKRLLESEQVWGLIWMLTILILLLFFIMCILFIHKLNPSSGGGILTCLLLTKKQSITLITLIIYIDWIIDLRDIMKIRSVISLCITCKRLLLHERRIRLLTIIYVIRCLSSLTHFHILKMLQAIMEINIKYWIDLTKFKYQLNSLNAIIIK